MGVASLMAQNAYISNVQAQQRPGTKFVDITYDLDVFDGSSVDVYLQISELGDGNYNLPVVSITGDGVSAPTSQGKGKKITWNAGADWDGNFTNQAVAKLTLTPPVNTAPTGFALIPAGNFVMGDTFNEGDSNERPTRTVYVSAFYMQKTEVTKAQWDEVATWAQAHGYDITAADGAGKAANHPVHSVTWYECVKWCNAKSEKEGRTPVYTVSGSVYKTGDSTPDINYAVNGYRLPTEAEWEKAARGGLSGKRFPWGDEITHSLANYRSFSSYSYDTSATRDYHPTYNDGTMPYTSPVESFAANGYGLFDMVGNVWEWCNDWYGTYAGNTDPIGAVSGSDRVIRGGSWYDDAYNCRVAYRYFYYPDNSHSFMGFRPVSVGSE